MEAPKTINDVMTGKRIIVPNYQRAYSWETPSENKNSKTHTDVFLADLEEYTRSKADTPYYFGHFLFEKKPDGAFGVIDGQQRLTTIVIFLCAVFARLQKIRPLTEEEEIIRENIIKRKSSYIFSTVDYDNPIFRDYVIEQSRNDRHGLETASALRIVNAFDYFKIRLADKDEHYLVRMIHTVSEASCTTHLVEKEPEAIQMFIFQNNRGKKPSNLEIIKAQFMFSVHLFGGSESDALIAEIKERFEKIYKSISKIEYNIDEDDVLTYSLRVYFNSLWESDPVARINKLLAESDSIPFIKAFTRSLATSFEYLTVFFGKDQRENIEVHSLIALGGFSIVIPFIVKAYTFGLNTSDICKICSLFESLVLRDRLIGTRAELITRVNDVYQKFTAESPQLDLIIDRIGFIKNVPNEQWWWAYWNNSELERCIQGAIHPSTAKFLLWKYEHYLENKGKPGYGKLRYDMITDPELEHIAPQTAPDDPVAAGYCEYDEEFRTQYLDCLGNYLLASKSHNCSIGNIPFKDKRKSYEKLAQHREIKDMTGEAGPWNKDKIGQRKLRLIRFILDNF